MDHELRRALRAAAHDPTAAAAVATALVRMGRIDALQGDWLRDVAAPIEVLRWAPVRVARSIRSCLGTEALAAGLVSLARVACEGAEVPFKAAGRTLTLCQHALLHGLTPDEQVEVERLRSGLVEYTAEYITPHMVAALWCLVRTTQAVERASTPWAWPRVPGILRCARAALPGRGQARRIRGALVRGVLDLHVSLELRFPPWGTLWVEERPLSGVRRGACAHDLKAQTASYRLALETGGRWRAITTTIRRCCLVEAGCLRRELALGGAAIRLERLAERELHPARARAVLNEADRLFRGPLEENLSAIPESALGTWATPVDAMGGIPLRVARRRPRPRIDVTWAADTDPGEDLPF